MGNHKKYWKSELELSNDSSIVDNLKNNEFKEKFDWIIKIISHYNLNTEQNLFQRTVQLHNSVNRMHNKKPWGVEKARNHYNSIGLNKNMIKLFFMNYIFYNFKSTFS